jgi:hypothetical protein
MSEHVRVGDGIAAAYPTWSVGYWLLATGGGTHEALTWGTGHLRLHKQGRQPFGFAVDIER